MTPLRTQPSTFTPTVATPPGETSLPTLLATLTPTLHPTTFAFATLPARDGALPPVPPPGLHTHMTFHEPEGLTVITTPESAAAHGLACAFRCRMLTLQVRSSLAAVGLMAAVAAALAARGIACNPVSGFWHDHVFVPEGSEAEALEVLEAVAAEAARRGGE